MTTPKEAMKLKPCPFCGGEATWMKFGIVNEYFICCDNDECFGPKTTASGEDAAKQWNTRATASIQGEDAVERVAGCICQNQHRRGYCTEPGCPYSTSDAVEKVKALAHRFWSIHPSTIAAMNLTREEFYVREMMALLSTGLVPDEAAIRADEREKCAQITEDDERQDEWPKSVDVNRTSPSRIMQQTIAAAIRSNRREV